VSIIREKRGIMYDPTIADAFLRIASRLRTAPARPRVTAALVPWLRQASAL
jgi:hypothetical protein